MPRQRKTVDDAIAEAPAVRAVVNNVPLVNGRAQTPPIPLALIANDVVQIGMAIDSSTLPDAESISFGCEVSENGGNTWELMVRSVCTCEVIPEGDPNSADGVDYDYRWVYMSPRADRAVNTRFRFFVEAGPAITVLPRVMFFAVKG